MQHEDEVEEARLWPPTQARSSRSSFALAHNNATRNYHVMCVLRRSRFLVITEPARESRVDERLCASDAEQEEEQHVRCDCECPELEDIGT